MAKQSTGYGTRGGVNLLSTEDRVVVDSEVAEQIEPIRRGNVDELDNVLTTILGHHPGIRINQYMIDVEVPGSRNIQIEFDRHYLELGLIVDMMQLPLNDADKEENRLRKIDHQHWAVSLGKKYLAIEGSITMQELVNVL